MRGFVNFLKFNNAIPIAVSFLLLGAASTFAYTNPEVLVEKEQKVVSIDNTYISEIDLKRFTPEVEILSVEEDDVNYYVTYTFTTIALKDAVWQDVTTTEVMQIEKTRLGAYRDLGLYVTQELSEKIKAEKKRLAETQVFELKQKTTKKVATSYKGLVGAFMTDEVTDLGKYKPRVKPPKPKQEVQTFARPPVNPPKPEKQPKPVEVALVTEPVIVPEEEVLGETTTEPGVDTQTATGTTDENTNDSGTTTEDTTDNTSDGAGGGSVTPTEPVNEAPFLTVLGDNPATLEVGESYTDLGATVSDDSDINVAVFVYVNGELVDAVVLDTSTSTTYSIVYEATDSAGAVSSVERIVEVIAPAIIEEPPQATETPTKPTTTTPITPEQTLEETVVVPPVTKEKLPVLDTQTSNSPTIEPNQNSSQTPAEPATTL